MLTRPRYSYRLQPGLRRREFLAGLLAAGASAGCRESSPAANLSTAKNEPFPESLGAYSEDFENWSKELQYPGLRTFAPRTPEDVVLAANWAARNGHGLRARGMRHNWSPLAASPGTTAASPLVVADTTQFLNRMEMVAGSPIPAVRVEAGALMEDLLAFMEENGFGFTAVPAPGAISVGGALAVNAHGCAVPAQGETPLPQQTYGSLSNRVLALTAVVWDAATQAYTLRRYERSDTDIGALLTHLGRCFITEVTLAVEPNQNLRCVSYTDITADELFAAPGSGGRDVASFLDSGGRVETIWYAFTERPWLKVWSVCPEKPAESRAVTEPYNYPFSDNIPEPITDFARDMVTSNPQAAPRFGAMILAVSEAGLTATDSYDLWGPSKNTMLFIKATTLRVHPCSYVLLTSRAQVQKILSEFTAEFRRLLAVYQAADRYPVNMAVEYRITGLDHATDIGAPGAQTALLSAIAPDPDHPEWDCAVWLTVLTIPGTPDMYAFFREIEQWLQTHFSPSEASPRPEWTKGWAYSEDSAWTDAPTLAQYVPGQLRAGRGSGSGWDAALRTLERLDPRGIYGQAFQAGFMRR